MKYLHHTNYIFEQTQDIFFPLNILEIFLEKETNKVRLSLSTPIPRAPQKVPHSHNGAYHK